MRDSTSMIIAESLYKKGAIIKLMILKLWNNAKIILPKLTIVILYKRMHVKDVDAIIIATEWNDFRALNFKLLKKQMKEHIIFDLSAIFTIKMNLLI